MSDNSDQHKRRNLGSRLKAAYRRAGQDKSVDEKFTDDESLRVATPTPAPASESMPKPIASSRQAHEDKPSTKKGRPAAEKQFKDAAANLNNATSKVSERYPNLTLSKIDTDDDNLDQVARNLETAIAKIIEVRNTKLEAGSKQLWKKCAERWFNAVFPVVRPCVHKINVNNPPNYCILHTNVVRALFQLHTLLS
jgi:hypothetical protein